MICYVTFSGLDEAKTVSRGAVEQKFAACANISPNMTSVYQWEERLVEATEVVVLFKTTKAKIQVLENWIRSVHSYECPCIIWWQADGVTPAYGQWIEEQLTVRP